jgi:hypothetical protein
MGEVNASIADIPLPRRMANLKISPKGFPVPWFVAWIDGVPDFRVVDTPKVARAFKQRLCWLCGQTLGRRLAFVIGPMCAVNRTTSEPPSHRECAEYAVAACPFLTKPRMRRNEKDLPLAFNAAGIPLDRNPGVTLIWMTRTYNPFRTGAGQLFRIGEADEVAFYREGRTATRAEILDSIDSGMVLLRDIAREEGPQSIDALEFKYREAVQLLPAT